MSAPPLVWRGQPLELLRTPAKRLRAELVARHLGSTELERTLARVVCFTCGNAGRELRRAGLRPVTVGPQEPLQAGRWWTPSEIRAAWPGFFDATSGHLPAWAMVELGELLHAELGPLPDRPLGVPTGSGETLAALRWSYPRAQLVAVVNLDANTQHDPRMPLAPLVAAGPVLDCAQLAGVRLLS